MLLDLHPALLLLLLLDFLLLILLLTPFDGSLRGRSGGPAEQQPSPARRRQPAPAACSSIGDGQLCGSCGGVGSSPTLPVPLEDKASVSDITIAPFPRRTPPVKSFVSVRNKSLLQV